MGIDESGWIRRGGGYGQRFDASGTAAGVEFKVNTFTTNNQNGASVSQLAEGGFIVTWQSYDQDGESNGIYSQLFSFANGNVTNGDDVVFLFGPGQTVNALDGNDTIFGSVYSECPIWNSEQGLTGWILSDFWGNYAPQAGCL